MKLNTKMEEEKKYERSCVCSCGCQMFTFAFGETIHTHLIGSRHSILYISGREKKGGGLSTPVPVHVGGTESKAVVEEGGVDDGPALRPLQEVTQVTQVSVTTPDAVPGAVLIQHKHLAGAEPSLHTNTSTEEETCHRRRLSAELQARAPRWTSLTRQQKVSLSLWSNVSRCTISKSDAWSKLQGLAEINSSMPCF